MFQGLCTGNRQTSGESTALLSDGETETTELSRVVFTGRQLYAHKKKKKTSLTCRIIFK